MTRKESAGILFPSDGHAPHITKDYCYYFCPTVKLHDFRHGC